MVSCRLVVMLDALRDSAFLREPDLDSLKLTAIETFQIFYELINRHFDLLFSPKFWSDPERVMMRRRAIANYKGKIDIKNIVIFDQVSSNWLICIHTQILQRITSSNAIMTNKRGKLELELMTLPFEPTRLNGGFFIDSSENLFEGKQNPITILDGDFWTLPGASQGVAYYQIPEVVSIQNLGSNLIPFFQFIYPITRYAAPGGN